MLLHKDIALVRKVFMSIDGHGCPSYEIDHLYDWVWRMIRYLTILDGKVVVSLTIE